MGVVYRAHDTLLERVVALKIIATSIEDNPELRERFFREARAAGQLSHRNVITIHDLGEHEGQPYLAMEFLTGEDLQHRLSRQEPMSLRRKLEIGAEICDGLSYAHRRGLIHRDIKPANVFITDEGVVKLLDFGLARMVASELTRSNMMMGTVNYMAPEQVRGERTDHRADIFSFGVVLYEMLSGRKAFQGDSFATTLYKILQDVPEPLLNIDPTLPPEIAWLVEKALAKPRDERYQDLTDLSRDLAIIRQHLSGSDAATMAAAAPSAHRSPSDPPRVGGTQGGTPQPATPPSGERVPSGVHPARLPWAAMAVGGTALAAVVALAAWMALRPAPGTGVAPTNPSPPATETKPPTVAEPPPPSQVQAPDPAELERRRSEAAVRQSLGKVADIVRGRMSNAKAAARQAGPAALGSAAFAAAAAAEREGNRLYQARQYSEATSKFYEAIDLFRTAESTARTAHATPSQAQPQPQPQPQPTAPPAAAPPVSTTPALPGGETPVQLPPAPAPRVPPPAPAPERSPPVITAAEGTASPGSEEAIRDVLKRYEQALETRSIDALKRVWPTLQGSQEDAFRKEFLNARRIEVDIDDSQITVSGASATVTFVRHYRLSTVDGQRPVTTSRTTMTLRRNGRDWHIERLQFASMR